MNFKGLDKQGNWVYGHGFVPRGDGTSIIVNSINDLQDEFRIVDDITICVGSSIEANNYLEVFENDIIMIRFGSDEYYYVVKYDQRCGQFYLLNSNVRFDTIKDLSAEIRFDVVGNIHSDKELLNRALKRKEDKS